MNCSAKELNGTDLPNRWTVEVIYRDGSLPTTFTIEGLKDIVPASPRLRACPQCCAGGHSARRSRPANNSSHVASIRIGAPHIKSDFASPAEAGSTKGNGARSVSARVS